MTPTKSQYTVILVCGGRVGRNLSKSRVFAVMDHIASFHKGENIVVVHGGAVWVDTWSGQWAKARGHIECVVAIDDAKDGSATSAPFHRNQRMLDENPGIAMCLGFPGGGGTFDMMTRAHKKNIPVADVTIEHDGSYEIKWWKETT